MRGLNIQIPSKNRTIFLSVEPPPVLARSGFNLAWSHPLVFPTVENLHRKILNKCCISRGGDNR